MLRKISIPMIALLSSVGAAVAFSQQLHIVGEQFMGTAHVVDGDTIHLDGGDRVRIFGIDAAEKDQSCDRPSGAYACGAEASAYLRLLVEGRTVVCTARAIDRYHRTVASCSIDGKDIGAEMVSSGHAVEYRRYTSIYDGQEMQARNARRGLWAGTFTDPADYRHAKRNGSF